jgi:hypothetical protein
MFGLILLVLAFVCFALSAAPVASPFWNRLISVGLAAWVLSLLLGGRLP